MVVRSENFLRGGARDHAPCCVKGRKNSPTAIFKAFSKNAGIGDRSGDLAVRSRESTERSRFDFARDVQSLPAFRRGSAIVARSLL